MSASVQKCPDCGKPLSAVVHPEDRTAVYLYCTATPCNPLALRNLGVPATVAAPKKKRRR